MANNKKFRILALDPGLTTTGWSILDRDYDTGNLTVIKTGEMHPSPTVDKKNYRDEVERYDKRTMSLTVLREEVTKLITTFSPDAISCEDAFINPKRPAAYGALCMIICTVKLLCRDIARKPLIVIPTKIAKLEMTHSGSSGKYDVISAVSSNPHIIFKDEIEKTQMSEHVADSIAVAYAFSRRYTDLINLEIDLRTTNQGAK
jgi:Holliday junction resolvasome RuvABC endonuclease subunit